MASKKSAPSGEAVLAAANICIDGRHFDRGDEITGVDPDQLAVALRARRALTSADYLTRFGGGAAPVVEGKAEASTEEQAEA